ncbi:ketoacyl-ACP synthase III [Streptomyces sp. CHD11]|uniref:3-oxoacyl-ACP synthase III family protein n=1 Tax=Streptomyces sp. CHD11 TaxID=2741325 RepID=UPI001BFC4E87|nr:ketoacyl-ACP synthase III [Streptomyces sp. CHD11]MBT3152358.1 ketoacyl-ACP synthase III [Streptomyces sp. CHD11]
MNHRDDCRCGCALASWAVGDPSDEVAPSATSTPLFYRDASRGTAANGILGCGAYLPERVVDNEEAGASAGVTGEWIAARTGILARRYAHPDQAASDLAEQAAHDALEDAGLRADQLSLIIVATSTPDSPQPPTACLLQDRIGALHAAAFDVNAVCSGFVYAVEAACRMVPPGEFALVVGVDLYSRIIDPADRRTVSLFGDGAGAVVIGPVPEGRGVIATQLTSHGDQHDLIKVPAGGSRIPASKESLQEGLHYFTMNGYGVRMFVRDRLPGEVHRLLANAGVGQAAVRHFIPHQANGRMIDELLPELDLSRAVVHRTLDRYGNTGAASLPVTLAATRGEIAQGDLVLLAGFGGGMSTGLMLLRW